MPVRLCLTLVALCIALATPAAAGPQPPAGWTDGYVMANGIRIHYWRSGGNRPPMVMAHGSSDDGLCWTNLAREFQDSTTSSCSTRGATACPIRRPRPTRPTCRSRTSRA